MSELTFKISAALKNIIGRDLITDDFIAVFELVKNSYDAHATKVDITFEENKIIIVDNGKGMNLDDLKDKWLFVAYSAKNEGVEDEDLIDSSEYRDFIKSKRYYAGAKGIGRFSCDRLGNKLVLKTRKFKTNDIEQLTINWDNFEKDAEEEFYDIKVLHETLNASSLPRLKKGTILEISGLSSSWERKKLQDMKHSLEKLINPFETSGNKSKNKFSINIICKREKAADAKEKLLRNKINGKVNNFIFETLNVKTTQIFTSVNKDSIITELIDRGEPIYKIKEPNNNYKLVEDAKYHVFFLNTIAKANFTRNMGLQPVKFGSIFLFKNGFRVYPFGNVGDDSLKIDRRHQQRYAATLATRDLLGRIEIFSDNTEEFKEASSRDGGMIASKGYEQLIESFIIKCLRRLERYVVDVQWKYTDDEALRRDRDREDVSLLDNIKGKSRIINIIKKLADNKKIEIVSYNKNFLDIIEDKILNAPPEVFNNLAKIAKKTNDKKFEKQILQTEKKYKKLIKEKETAERKAREAEEAAIRAKEARKAEEEKRREEEYKRLKAEDDKRKAEEKAKKADEARISAEKEKKHRENQVRFLQSVKSIEYEDVRDLNHIIGINSDLIKKKILIFKRKIDRGNKISNKDFMNLINSISLANNKILAVTKFTTKGNFLKACSDTRDNIVAFITNYIENIYKYLYDDINIEVINSNVKYVLHFRPIEITIVIDNLISNSRKKRAKKIEFAFNIIKGGLEITCRDYGKCIDKSIPNPELIFEEGFTTTNGSGLGLAHVKKIIKDLKGKITVNTEFKDGFEILIRLTK